MNLIIGEIFLYLGYIVEIVYYIEGVVWRYNVFELDGDLLIFG